MPISSTSLKTRKGGHLRRHSEGLVDVRRSRMPVDSKRSAIMRAVRREKTGPELAVASYLTQHEIRFRHNVRSLPGSPDLANVTKGFAVYVHGCFWHRHANCPKTTTPKDNAKFWATKFSENIARDARNLRSLRRAGFETAVVWECETKDERKLARALRRVVRAGTGSQQFKHIRRKNAISR
jgi:DNA mismatch endonuclease, patch repair protein